MLKTYEPVTHIWTTHWHLMWADDTRNRKKYNCAPWAIPRPAPEFLIQLPVVAPPCIGVWAFVPSPQEFGPPHDIQLHEFDLDHWDLDYFWRSKDQAVADITRYLKTPVGKHNVKELEDALATRNEKEDSGVSFFICPEDTRRNDGRDLNLDDCDPGAFNYNASIPLDALLKSNRRRWGNF